MSLIIKLSMINLIVQNMSGAKAFYADKLGLEVKQDYRQDEGHWWVSLALPEGGVTITLTTFHEGFRPGTMSLYFATSDIAAAHKELNGKGVNVNPIKDDLYGPGSGVKWFNLADPDGNLVHILQA